MNRPKTDPATAVRSIMIGLHAHVCFQGQSKITIEVTLNPDGTIATPTAATPGTAAPATTGATTGAAAPQAAGVAISTAGNVVRMLYLRVKLTVVNRMLFLMSKDCKSQVSAAHAIALC